MASPYEDHAGSVLRQVKRATLADATPRRATAFPHRTTMERLISGASSLIQHNRCRRPSALTDHRKSAMRHVASHAKATHMYGHLLVSVDGGGLSERAMTASIELAKKLGASITGFVAEPFAPPASTGGCPSLQGRRRCPRRSSSGPCAKDHLALREALARSRCPFRRLWTQGGTVEDAILAAAKEQHYLIVMMKRASARSRTCCGARTPSG